MKDYLKYPKKDVVYGFMWKHAENVGIELYFGGIESAVAAKGQGLNQLFISPEVTERVNCCMVGLREHGLTEIYTVKDTVSIPFPFKSQELTRTALDEVDKGAFQERGIEVITLDKIADSPRR